MRILLTLLLSSFCGLAAVRTSNFADNKTTIGLPGQQTSVFAQITGQVQLTIACWVKYDWTDAGVNTQLGAGDFQGLVSKGHFDTFAMQLGLSSASEKLGFSFSSPAGTYHTWRTTANSVQTNSWMHIACSFTYSNGNSMKFYINGVDTAGSWVAGDGNAVGMTNAVSFHTFIYQKGSGSSFFGGAMSDLAIWTNALTSAEVFKLAKSKVKYMPIQIRPDTLIFYWPMDTHPVTGAVGSANNNDTDRAKSRFILDAGGNWRGEKTLSYYPNQ